MTEQKRNGIGMTSARTRERLIERLKAEGVRDVAVLERIRSVPRHLFVDEALASRAYEDTPLPIGFSQTISQPLVVALMTEALIAGNEGKKIPKVLEIGTGSGYQTAVLAPFVQHIYSVERIQPLVQRARCDAEAHACDAARVGNRATGALAGKLRADGRGDGALTCAARAAPGASHRSQRCASALCSRRWH